MVQTNISPYLGQININSNKEYYVSEYEVIGDNFYGTINIALDRPANVYVLSTEYDETTGIYVSKDKGISQETDNFYKCEIKLFQEINTRFVVIIEYDGMKLGEEAALMLDIQFRKLLLDEIYNTDFYMFETRSGIPYPVHEIGTYSRYEFDIPQTMTTSGYKRIGIIYDSSNTSSTTGQPSIEEVKNHCETFLKGIFYYNYRPVILKDFNIELPIYSNHLLDCILFNTELLRNKYVQNKVIIIAERACNINNLDTSTSKILRNIISEPNYDNMVELVNELIDISYEHGINLITAAQEMQDLIDDDSLTNKMTSFLTGIYGNELNEIELTKLGIELEFLSELQCIMVNTVNSGKRILKTVNNAVQSTPVSGRLDIQGESKHTGKYASSKILVGHTHENERGYLKHTVATDRYGKTHKDPFVKNRELWGKEESYIYLDLLHATKNVFSNSDKSIRGVALLTGKQTVEQPKGTITFRFLDKDEFDENGTEVSIFPDKVFPNVYSAAYRVNRMNEITLDDGEVVTYVLVNKNVNMKMFIRQEGDSVSYIFWFSQRIGTFIYSFVDENGNKIKEDYIVEKRVSHAYEASPYIYVPLESDPSKKITYKLLEPKGVQYNIAREKHDVIYVTFKYTLIVADFIFELREKESNTLFEIEDDMIFTYKNLNETGTYDIVGSDLEPPHNSNPVIFKEVSNITYCAPIYIKIDKYNRYKAIGDTLINMVAMEIKPEITTVIKYSLIRSKFRFSFIDQQENTLIPAVTYPPDVKATHTADELLDFSARNEGEYYILESKPHKTYPFTDLTNYPTVELIATDEHETVWFNFIYNRLVGTIKINYLDSKTETPIDIEEFKDTIVFEKVSIVNIIESGEEQLEGFERTAVAPPEIWKNENKKWVIDREKTEAKTKLFVTPEELEIVYNVYYNAEYTSPEELSMNFLIDSVCEQRTFTKYLLVNEDDLILGKFDLGNESIEFDQYGLTLSIDKVVMDKKNGNVEVPPDTIQTSEQKYNGEIKSQSEVETLDHADRYVVSFKVKFMVDLSKATRHIVKLVGFINLNEDPHGEGHRIFELRYNNEDLNSLYAQYVPIDFPQFRGVSFNSSQFNNGQKFTPEDKRIFLKIDLSKETDDEIFTIYPGSSLNNIPSDEEELPMTSTFTIS